MALLGAGIYSYGLNMAYIAMAYVGVASLCSDGLHRFGLYSHGLCIAYKDMTYVAMASMWPIYNYGVYGYGGYLRCVARLGAGHETDTVDPSVKART